MAGRARILLLHDDTRAVETATALLEAAGYAVTISGRRHGRVEFIRALNPELVLFGVRLPYVEGDEVLQACSRHLSAIPLLILSGCDPAYLDEVVRRSGAAGFVRTLRLREELVARVAACLARRPPLDQASRTA
jgi:DNA-binding response OmpR family regulator